MIAKRVKITINNLRQADSLEYCHYIQDVLIDVLLSTEYVTNVYFERNSLNLIVAFSVKIGSTADYICTLCKEYVASLLEQNDRLIVQIEAKEDISDHLMIYTINAQAAV